MQAGRFVAIGDSFTEGVGDPHLHYPNGLRGWADRMARQLGRADPRWEYANLALRSKRIDQVADEQLASALALRPTLATYFAGGNDLLALRADVDDVLGRYDEAVGALVDAGATVVVFTAFDPRMSALLEPLARRVRAFNAGVRDIADAHDTALVDHARLREYDDRRLWAPDRLHMNRWGHKRMAAAVLRTVGLEHTLRLRTLGDPPGRPPLREAAREEARFVRGEVLPLVRRRLTGRTDGDTALAKWPEPVHPAEGMKRLARRRAPSAGTPTGVAG
ncbi:SGNH/GDSL hydrolase family protein [Phycicoccus endophyticus]|uniref:SGNH/GDSL hydrolase family protein n=1 Tax=Phycicoccus endophyticus TaxID=1690220 RepID=A0A7G9R095_9MICO|nr:SGNH/GDSL hydrolase family protein [Phycicoccus endophyticus]NHI20177.1 SGNH/GDSL hydrolase family protein [Phycicoccus endophyticus]QNN49020.1 SGNH/GDSL hydrolase family protein [Phycicoccus endophyticus]GGL44669.1 SGNH hydrolase [Phycicoccus endophyticus]